MATAEYSLMSLLLFFFLHTPLRFSEGNQSGSHSLYSDCAGLPLKKCREHIRALRSDADSLRPIAARKPFLRLVTILTRIPHYGFLPYVSCTILYPRLPLGCVTGYQVIRVIRIFAKTYPFE